mmetsp:Transcript_19694/g.39065  ORF Transcript_19694/g.39065 Transcript_19694/m.39065 type:complete len:226 (+) Transcript_19694:1177-1854(+)
MMMSFPPIFFVAGSFAQWRRFFWRVFLPFFSYRRQHTYRIRVSLSYFCVCVWVLCAWCESSHDEKVAWKRRLWPELAALGLHYSLVCALKVPLAVCAGAVLLSGFMTATIVTVSHQTEDLLTEHQDDWVRRQFLTTRDVDTSNPFSEWLWGGMQYQLLHHLFPDMPRYKYPALRPMLEAFASSHNIEFRRMGEWKLIRRNLEVYRQVAKAPADPNALASTGGISI